MPLLVAAAAIQTGLWIDVPFVAEEKNGCGAAVISMVMEYWGQPADAAAIHRALYSPDASGTFAADLTAYLEQAGFRTFAFRAAWSDVREHLAKGRPLIACVRGAPLHYVVIVGLDPERKLLLVNDPARRKLVEVPQAEFERSWHRRWTLLAVPRQTK